MSTINVYQCKSNKNHIFTKETTREMLICPKCHHFADRVHDRAQQEELMKHGTLIEDSITTVAAAAIADEVMDYSSTDSVPDASPSNSDDFSGGGGDMGGGGASGEW